MRLIKPQVLGLTASNVTEAAYSEWVAGTTYATGNTVYVTLESDGTTDRTPHKIYESLTGSNVGNYPPDDSTNWLDVGATNRWRMFDDYVSSVTENAASIVVTVTPPAKVDTIALFNLTATSVTIKCTSGVTEVYNEEHSLIAENITDWFDYFFIESELKTDLVVTIPATYNSMTVEITITAASGNASCGHCVLGLSKTLGKTNYAPSIGIADYSTKETNTFGETYLQQRAFAKTISATVTLPSAAVDAVATALALVRSTPCVFQFNNEETDYTGLMVYGFYNDFSVILQSFAQSECNLEIEGLI